MGQVSLCESVGGPFPSAFDLELDSDIVQCCMHPIHPTWVRILELPTTCGADAEYIDGCTVVAGSLELALLEAVPSYMANHGTHSPLDCLLAWLHHCQQNTAGILDASQ